MKTKNKLWAIFIVLVLAFSVHSGKASAQQNNVSFQVFYDQLSPYGQWVDYPNYGYAWIPDAGPDFVPYSTRGNWVMTEYGWTWYSSYQWGWAPFHYGRWGYDNYYGWFWVPGGEWGPAWVDWRCSEGYFGWAPMEPGVTINFSFGMGQDGNYNHWIFMSDRYIGSSDMNRYYVSSRDHERIFRNSRIITNTYVDHRNHSTYVSGPSRRDVQRITGEKIKPVAIKESNKPGQDMSNGQLHIYRPQVINTSDKDHRSAPSKIVNRREADQPSQRAEVNQQRNDAPANISRERQSNTAVSDGNRANFNNTYRNNDAISNIKSSNSSNTSNTNNFKNNVKRNNKNQDTKASAKQQKDARQQSHETVTDKQSSPSNQQDKNSRQSQRRSKSDKDKK